MKRDKIGPVLGRIDADLVVKMERSLMGGDKSSQKRDILRAKAMANVLPKE